jgi:hypothetical protein
VHPAARSSTLGHRVSGNAIRSGGVPALAHAATCASREQARLFHSARPRRLWKNPFLTSLLRSHYNGNAGMRPERRLSGRNGWGGVSRPVRKQPFWRNCVKSQGRRGRAPFGSWHAYLIAWRRSRTRLAEHTREPSEVGSDYRPARGIHRCWRGRRGSRGIRCGKLPHISASS